MGSNSQKILRTYNEIKRNSHSICQIHLQQLSQREEREKQQNYQRKLKKIINTEQLRHTFHTIRNKFPHNNHTPIDHIIYDENNTNKRTEDTTTISNLILSNTKHTMLTTDTNLLTHPKFISLFGIYG